MALLKERKVHSHSSGPIRQTPTPRRPEIVDLNSVPPSPAKAQVTLSSSTSQKVCNGLGGILVLMGLVGFVSPAWMGMHLSVVHNLIHLISGVAALWVGSMMPPPIARSFCLWFGSAYGLLGLFGFMFGTIGIPTRGDMSPDRFLLPLMPGALELATNDHIVHLLLGAIFLAGGLSAGKYVIENSARR